MLRVSLAREQASTSTSTAPSLHSEGGRGNVELLWNEMRKRCNEAKQRVTQLLEAHAAECELARACLANYQEL